MGNAKRRHGARTSGFHHQLCLGTKMDKTHCLRYCLPCFKWREAPCCPKVLGIATISQHQVNRAGGASREQLGCPGDTVCHRLDCHHHHHHVLLAGSSTCAGPMHPGETPCTLLLLTDEPSPPFPVFPSLQEANGPKGLTPEKRGKKAQHIKTKQNKPIRNQESPCGSLQSAKSNKGRGRGFTSVV